MSEELSDLWFTTDRKLLRAAFARTLHCIAKETLRPALEGWWLHSESVDTLLIHASDGYRLIRHLLAIKGKAAIGGPFAIHRDEAKAILSFLASGDDDAQVQIASEGWSMTCGPGRLSGSCLSGTPPDWSAITSRNFADGQSFNMNGRYLAEASKALTSATESALLRIDHNADPSMPIIVHADEVTEWIMPARVPA